MREMTFVIIDDNPEDIKRISKALQPLKTVLPYRLFSFTSVEQCNIHIDKQTDLILLDLEFASLKTTSIYFIDQFDPSIPILIISHLTHYQRQLALKANIAGFVPKHRMDELLIPTIMSILLKDQPRAETLVVPTSSHKEVSKGFPIKDIRYIEIISYLNYKIVFVDKNSVTVRSLPFQQLCSEIKKQGIAELQPVSRNQIINTNYIKDVYITKNGRLAISMVGVPTPFVVGKNYASYFRSWYLE